MFNVVDRVSGYATTRLLKTKEASGLQAGLTIFIILSKNLHVYSGTEFNVDVLKLMNKHKVDVKSVVTIYHHYITMFVECFNKTLAGRLF